MNGPFVRARAEALADRIVSEADDDESRIQLAFLRCFGRPPDAEEQRRLIAFLDDPSISQEEDITDDRSTLESLCQALLSAAELRNLD